MGNRKSGWTKGMLVVLIVIGLMFAGIFVGNYFFKAKAADDPSNQPKNQAINRIDKKPVKDSKRDAKIEKQIMRKQQDEALYWKKQKEQMAANKPAPPAAPPPTKETAAPPATNSNEAQSGQPAAPPGNNKTVYLTFDDGPAPFSGELIALLEQYHFKATFFMIDGNIRRYPDAVKLMVKTGEAVGLHSVSHNVKQFYASANSVIAELTQNRNTLKEITGVDSYLMRTPYGSVPHMTVEYRNAVNTNGYLMWDWNIDSKDWYYKDARYVNDVIAALQRMANHEGPIVILLHERKETVAHLPALLDYLSKNGYTCPPIDSTMTPYQFTAR